MPARGRGTGDDFKLKTLANPLCESHPAAKLSLRQEWLAVMSDPVTNVEIEDVLSSIRRLVSADDRTESKAITKEDTPPEKLVLTPALRVSDEKADADQQEFVAPEIAEDQMKPDDDPQAIDQVSVEAEESDALEDTAEADGDAPVQDVWSDDEAESSDLQTDHLAEISEDEPEQDGLEDWGEAPSDEDDTEQLQAEEMAASQEDEDQARPPEEAEETDFADGFFDNPENLSARVAGFEEAIATRNDQWEPDGDSQVEENSAQPMEALHWEDSEDDQIEDAEIVPEDEGLEAFVPDDEAEEDVAFPDPAEDAALQAALARNAFADDDPLPTDEAILDEETLRDMVTEIVRQELQGALGERITRNVRKLVRREINRALSVQELE